MRQRAGRVTPLKREGLARMPSVETVTVLITDLVGSTGSESRLGRGAADELRDEHVALLRGAVQQDVEGRAATLVTTQSAPSR
jgi:class 3 adenylate cyclase